MRILIPNNLWQSKWDHREELLTQPSDIIWYQRSGSTLAHVIACCLTTPTHYLNQCSLEIIGTHFHVKCVGFAGSNCHLKSNFPLFIYQAPLSQDLMLITPGHIHVLRTCEYIYNTAVYNESRTVGNCAYELLPLWLPCFSHTGLIG